MVAARKGLCLWDVVAAEVFGYKTGGLLSSAYGSVSLASSSDRPIYGAPFPSVLLAGLCHHLFLLSQGLVARQRSQPISFSTISWRNQEYKGF